MKRLFSLLLVSFSLILPVQAGTMLLLNTGLNSSQSCNSFIPAASGVQASVYADFTSEGSAAPKYWFNSTCYNSGALWLVALGGTYTNSTGKYVYDNSGTYHLVSVAANVIPYSYNPSTGVALGYLGEPTATNLALWSRDLTQSGTWVATTMTTALTSVGTDGSANSATRLTATGVLAHIFQTPGLAAANRTYSVFMRRVTGSGTIKITVDGTTFSGDLSSSLNSSTYVRVTATQNVVPIIGIQIGTSGDAIDVDFNQLESGGTTGIPASAPSSPILTTTVTVARSADVFSWPVSFTGWSTTVGSAVVNISTSTGLASSSAPNAVIFSDGTTANRLASSVNSGGGAALLVTASSAAQANITVVGVVTSAYAINKLATAWAVNDFAALINNGTVATDSSGTIPTGINIANLNGGASTGGLLLSMAYWGSRISNTDMGTLTQ